MPTSQPYIKLAAIASNEAFYLPLWVYHHFSMGFDILEIWINHTTDNSWNVINKLKLRYGNHLIIIDADNDALDCRKKNISFQKYAYNEIYKKTLEQNFTHLMFLDIDELWIDRDFKSSIKDFISEHKDVNISCFQWFLDLADKSITLETFKFQSEITLQRNRHVKSLINLKSDIQSIGIHNHISNNGSYILGDGSKLNFGSSVDEGQISIDYYESRIDKIDRYFIFHRLYKSSFEYTASLLKSNLQTTESGVLKSNRKGYKRVVPQKFLLTWQIPNNKKRQLYDKGYISLLNELSNEIRISKALVKEQAATAKHLVESDPIIATAYCGAIDGLEFKLIKNETKPIEHTIEKYYINKNKKTVHITGHITQKEKIKDLQIIVTQGDNQSIIPSKIKNNINPFLKILRKDKKIFEQNFELIFRVSDIKGFTHVKECPFCLIAKTQKNIFILEREIFKTLNVELLKIISDKNAKARSFLASKPH